MGEPSYGRGRSAAAIAWTAVLFVALALAALGWGVAGERGREPFLLGGIQVNEPDHAAWAEELRRAGMNAVSVTVYARQGDWSSAHLWFEDEEEAVISEIRAAKRAGLHVVLILRLALDHAYEANRFLWHGMIHPESDAEVRAWFEQYQRFALAWAERAEAEGVDVLGIGSELNAMTSTRELEALPELHEYYLNDDKRARYRAAVMAHREAIAEHALWTAGSDGFATLESYLDAEIGAQRRWAERVTGSGEQPWEAMNRRRALLEEHWVALIEALRGVYTGRLTYAANFDQYREVGFWSHLDAIGINAYFPLRPPPGEPPPSRVALAAELEAGWRRVLEQIAAFRAERGLGDLPVLFTELGYTARRGSTIEPWASQGFSLVRWPTPAQDERAAQETVGSGGSATGGDASPDAGSAVEASPLAGPSRLMVWGEEPLDLGERALAIEALRSAARAVDPELLAGLLYWKLSTIPSHREIEPFVLVLGEEREDPMLGELRRFTDP